MESARALCKLSDLKSMLDVADTSEDNWLEILIGFMSEYIVTYCGRNLKYGQYTEFHIGDGEYDLVLNEYPLVGGKTAITLYEDLDYEYAATDEIASGDFEIFAGEGRIIRTDAKFYKNAGPSIKAIYKAGYSIFRIVVGINDKIDFEETADSELTATITAGTYNADDLATEIETQLTAEGASVYTVSYDINSHKIILASDRAGGGGTFKLLWNTGSNISTSIAPLLGFDISIDDSDAASHISDNVIIGVPNDLQLACIELCSHNYRLGERGGEAVRSLSIGDGAVSYSRIESSDIVKGILAGYKRVDIYG